MEEQLFSEAKAQQAEVDREVEEARGEEQRAWGAKQATAQALRESVADDGERHLELQDEVQGCLWARMRIAARKEVRTSRCLLLCLLREKLRRTRGAEKHIKTMYRAAHGEAGEGGGGAG